MKYIIMTEVNLLVEEQKSINFFESLNESDFCRGTQSNGKGQHCAYGHLFVNPKSPFYKKDNSFNNGIDDVRKYTYNEHNWDGEIKTIQEIVHSRIAGINNDAPEGKIKETCIAWFKNELNKLN